MTISDAVIRLLENGSVASMEENYANNLDSLIDQLEVFQVSCRRLIDGHWLVVVQSRGDRPGRPRQTKRCGVSFSAALEVALEQHGKKTSPDFVVRL